MSPRFCKVTVGTLDTGALDFRKTSNPILDLLHDSSFPSGRDPHFAPLIYIRVHDEHTVECM